MIDTNARIEVLERRIAELEAYVQEANRGFVRFQDWVYGLDRQYQTMLAVALRKYDVLRRFAETAGPMVLECFDGLFPDRAGAKARDLTLMVRGSEEIN